MNKITLFNDKEDCCGCGACKSICPKSAISMQQDSYGFLYPIIDEQVCIACHACEEVCGYQHRKEDNKPLRVLAAAHNDEDKVMKSASGGVFAALAETILLEGGIVFGAAIECENNQLVPKHIGVENVEGLIKLQGSKYVQSEMGDTYKIAKERLLKGSKVLFSGTPCQISGLKQYLGKDYDNLLTVDVICHGVPNAKLFQDYIRELEGKLKGKILDFKFRDKSRGWGHNSRVIYRKNNKLKEKYIACYDSSYFKLFLQLLINRDSCYSCKCRGQGRPGDITLGDYWGVDKEHPELFQNNDTQFSQQKGISVVIISSKKGQDYIQRCNTMLHSIDSTYEKASRKNGNLKKHSKKSNLRQKVLEVYQDKGYEAVERYFKKNYRINRIKGRIKRLVPNKFKITIKKII